MTTKFSIIRVFKLSLFSLLQTFPDIGTTPAQVLPEDRKSEIAMFRRQLDAWERWISKDSIEEWRHVVSHALSEETIEWPVNRFSRRQIVEAQDGNDEGGDPEEHPVHQVSCMHITHTSPPFPLVQWST